MFELQGRTALVTGAGQGIGAGIAAMLARAGARRRGQRPRRGPRRATPHSPCWRPAGSAIAVPFDVTDEAGVIAAWPRSPTLFAADRHAREQRGRPGDMGLQSFADMDPPTGTATSTSTCTGRLRCIRAVLPGMRERGWGRVIQISSGAAQSGLRIGVSLYGASKSAIEGFLRHLSQEVATDGVTVNAIALGLMGNSVPDLGDGSDVLARIARMVPVGRLGAPEDAGALVVFVASNEASWLTGQTIQLNGGQTTT